MENQDPSLSQFTSPDPAFVWPNQSGRSDEFDDYFERYQFGCHCDRKRYEELRSRRLRVRFSKWRKRVWLGFKRGFASLTRPFKVEIMMDSEKKILTLSIIRFDDFADYFLHYHLVRHCGRKRYEEWHSRRWLVRFSKWFKKLWTGSNKN